RQIEFFLRFGGERVVQAFEKGQPDPEAGMVLHRRRGRIQNAFGEIGSRLAYRRYRINGDIQILVAAAIWLDLNGGMRVLGVGADGIGAVVPALRRRADAAGILDM